MFDIGFLEIMVIMIIALMVIGPERMPEVARKLGTFMGKMRNFINQIKEDSPLKDTVDEVRSAMDIEDQKRSISNMSKELQNGLNFDDTGLKMDDFERPFGDDTSVPQSSQFNKAPSQPDVAKDNASNDESKATEQTNNSTAEDTSAKIVKPEDVAAPADTTKDNKNS